MDNVLVTGANGFLGRYICRELYKLGATYKTLLRNPTGYERDIQGDLTDAELTLRGHTFDYVIHAAGKAHLVPKTEAEKQAFLDVNYQGTMHLLTALEKSGKLPKSFVFISTIAVYGVETGEDYDESTPLNAADPYGRSKIMAEEALADWCERHEVTLAVLRLPLIAGKDAPGNLQAMREGILNGRYLGIGSGQARRSVVLAEDVAAIIPKAAEVGGTYNLTDGYHPSFRELEELMQKQLQKKIPMNLPGAVAKAGGLAGDLIQATTGKRFPLNSRTYGKMTQTLTFSDAKARRELGWSPRRVPDHPEQLAAEKI